MRAATAGEQAWTAVVTSPLSRCRDFAEALARERALALGVDERLKEVGFGAWEGRTHAELEQNEPGAVFAFKRLPRDRRPAGAEPLSGFHDRVAAAYEALLDAHRGGHVLVVCHAGVIRMAICHALGLSPGQAYRLNVGSAAMARVRVEERDAGRLDTLLDLSVGAKPT